VVASYIRELCRDDIVKAGGEQERGEVLAESKRGVAECTVGKVTGVCVTSVTRVNQECPLPLPPSRVSR
jgi:hypothetical protein